MTSSLAKASLFGERYGGNAVVEDLKRNAVVEDLFSQLQPDKGVRLFCSPQTNTVEPLLSGHLLRLVYV